MQTKQKMPDLFVTDASGKKGYGTIKNPVECSFTGRFGAASEWSFKVPKKFYNLETESWAENTVYGYLVPNNLLFSTDTTVYFKLTGKMPGDSDFYAITAPSLDDARIRTDLSYDTNKSTTHFDLQNATKLFDVGKSCGYIFHPWHLISQVSGFTGGAVNYLPMLNSANGRAAAENSISHTGEYRYITCTDYIPVSPGDVIAISNTCSISNEESGSGNLLQPDDNIKRGEFSVFFYTDTDPTTYVSESVMTNTTAGVKLYIVSESTLPNGGFVRVGCTLLDGVGAFYEHDTADYTYSYTYLQPNKNMIIIYSGERFCKKVELDTDAQENMTLQWFVITNTEEESDGINTYKNITARSYEVTLADKIISLSESTLPFYIPDAITNAVSDDNSWIYDANKFEENSYTVTTHKGAQKLRRGILNYLLDELPGWSAGIIPKDLMVRYRNIPDVDDVSIYSLLTDTIPNLYNCFIFFDTMNKTISAATISDLYDYSRQKRFFLTWHNALQTLQKTNCDDSCYTALRVHTGDDTYGVGLVNPTGNGFVYYFDKILSDVDYKPANNVNRTLKDALQIWIEQYNNQLDAASTYQTNAKALIDNNMQLIQLKSQRSVALSKYRAVADEINVCFKERYQNYANIGDLLVPEMPYSTSYINGNDFKNRVENTGRSDLCVELSSAAESYWGLCAQINSTQAAFDDNKAQMKTIAEKFTINPNHDVQYAGIDNLPLTYEERLELSYYIHTGSWTHNDITFSNTYSAEDIYNTLVDVRKIACDDLMLRLSGQNYDFAVTTANVSAIDGFSESISDLCLGDLVFIDYDNNQTATPMLLEYHQDYINPDNFEFVFTTDPTRKPMQFRFADLYSTITQTSVTDNTFTFDG